MDYYSKYSDKMKPDNNWVKREYELYKKGKITQMKYDICGQ